jgi:hypothetical protein
MDRLKMSAREALFAGVQPPSRCSGPWSLKTTRRFWEGFAPAELATQQEPDALRTVFSVEGDWSLADVHVSQQGSTASLTVLGDGDLDQAAAQACRFLSLEIDARGWPGVARLDPVIADAQKRLPGLRPCGFHSPYEAAAWAVLSQRLRIVQAARLRPRAQDHRPVLCEATSRAARLASSMWQRIKEAFGTEGLRRGRKGV